MVLGDRNEIVRSGERSVERVDDVEFGEECVVVLGEEVGGMLGVEDEVKEIGDLLRSACDLVVSGVTCKARYVQVSATSKRST